MKQFLLITWFLIGSLSAFAQNFKNTNEKAFKILDKALGQIIESQNVAVKFDAIGFDLKEPKEIFSLPVYKVFRGGYLYIKGKKFEMQMGASKSLCDGKILVVVDETSKMMYVDSVEASNPLAKGTEEEKSMAMSNSFFAIMGDHRLTYEGIERFSGRSLHRIRAVFTGDVPEVTYWVDEKLGTLYMMSERHPTSHLYTVYTVSSIRKVPDNHSFSVHLPKGRELEKYYGYEVIDNRFIRVKNK